MLYRFAGCELDPAEHRLLVHGEQVTLTPKVFETLVLLVRRAGHVVSKDELMAVLWPRGFVHESNLTKHIWLIRKALGEDGEGRTCIETVPKLGYRFVAPVISSGRDEVAVVAAAAVSVGDDGSRAMPDAGVDAVAETAPPAVAAWRGWRMPLLAIAALAIVAIALFAIQRREDAVSAASGAAAGPAQGMDPSAVAIVGFNNLSQNPKDGWLGPALAQMLATEVSAGGRLHAVPDELTESVRPPASAAGGYTSARLAMLQQRLGARYVLSGGYFVSDAGSHVPQVRIDLALQDATSGRMLAMLTRTAPVAALPQVVSQTGIELRRRFDLPSISGAQLKRVANVNPPTAEVARYIGFALDALHGSDPARARDELLLAIAQAPSYAPAYAYLAQAWSALGYRSKARAAIAQAAANAGDLPQEQRLQIQAQQMVTEANWPEAIHAYRELATVRPDNPNYRLALIGAQLEAGKADEAEVTLKQLRGGSGDAGDPRLELAASRIAAARDDRRTQLAHAQLALRTARARGEPGLIANSELTLGVAYGDSAAAEPLLRAAIADYRRIGNPHGEAQSYQNLANLLLGMQKTQAARETYQQAMAIYQQIGDLDGVAAIYDNLTRMLWAAGDRDGAETAIREALRIGRETDDLPRQAWSLAGLATILSDEAASEEAGQMYREALVLDRRSGQRSHHAFVQATYADFLRQRGDLAQAEEVCADAQHEAHALDDRELKIGVDFTCAQVALDRGRIDAAVATATAVLREATAANDTFDAANAQLLLGQIAMGQGRWITAREQLRSALKGWTDSDEVAGQAATEGMLALCAAALGDVAGRTRAMMHADALRKRITQRAEVAPLDVALAQLQGETADRNAAIARLDALATDMDRRNWPGLALEARLASMRLLERRGTSDASRMRNTIDKMARAKGYGWVLARLDEDSGKPGLAAHQ